MIPKIFHQVWLGGKSLPKKEKRWQSDLLKLNSGWNLKVWDENNIAKLSLFQNELYDKLSNYSEKSDYIRYLCVYDWGGVYLDTDIQLIKNFDSIINTEMDFFIGEEHSQSASQVRLNGALFGATKNSKLLMRIITKIETEIRSVDFKKISSEKIGPGFISPIILKNSDHSVKIFAKDFFHPIPWWFKGRASYDEFISENTHAIHHFSGSWKPYKRKFFEFVKNIIKIKHV